MRGLINAYVANYKELYCCLRPRGCFDSQILEDEAEHNFEHGVILLNS